MDFRRFMIKVFRFLAMIILIAVFSTCGNMRMRSLNPITEDHNCYGEPDNNRTIYSPMEEKLVQQGALKSRKINLESGIGMIEKTARLFVLNNREIRIVFHLMHSVDLEIKKFDFVIRGDSGVLVSDEMQVDYQVSVGGMAEEQTSLIYPEDRMGHLYDDKEISIQFNDFAFNFPFNCREAFRELRDERGFR